MPKVIPGLPGAKFLYTHSISLALLLCFAAIFSLVPVQASPPSADTEQAGLELPAYPAATTRSPLDQKLLSIMKDAHLAGLSAAAFQGDKILWTRGYGWADLRSQRPVTENTIFRAASISKMFTATALLQLYEQGKFQLDDDISRYLGYPVRNPSYPDEKITFRQLLTHTSSITDNGEYNQLVENDPEQLKIVTLRELLTPDGSAFTPATFADYPPGTQFRYSNLGTGIVGSLVEALSGERFESYCRNHIFRPLSLDAGFDPADVDRWQNIAVLYRPTADLSHFLPMRDDFQGQKPTPLQIDAARGSALGWSPAGGVHISISDLSRFMLAHMNGGAFQNVRLLKKETVDLMDQLHWSGNGMDGFYRQKGLQIHVTDDLVPGRRLSGHSAEAYGLIGDAYFDSDSRFGIAFLINGGEYKDSAPFYAVENRIAKTLFDELAPKSKPVPQTLRANNGSTTLSLNNRKIIMPQPAALFKTKAGSTLFIPALSAADAFRARMDNTGSGQTLTYSLGKNTAVITAGKAELAVNGKKIPLPQAPYFSNGQLMVPLKELSRALNVSAAITF
ncbi:MAG TPA: serine hydrolase [Patescibacteria group bacterium]|nr:serine hydrolase [Patescibacteria group bacterium]